MKISLTMQRNAHILLLSVLLFACGLSDAEAASDSASPNKPPEWWDEDTPSACEGESTSDCRQESIDVEGVERTYLVTGSLDAHCNKPGPLVLVWHGSGGNGEWIRRRFSLSSIGREDTIVVYPNTGRFSYWNRDLKGEDIRLFDALLRHVAGRYCVDPRRVFSVGHSNGGRFVEVLGCHRGQAHRALASIAAAASYVTSCPTRAPMWITHGRKDRLLPISNGKAWLRTWASLNGCDKVGFAASFPDDICSEVSGCDIPVVWCPHTSNDLQGHGVPPFAEVEIERFFERFSR